MEMYQIVQLTTAAVIAVLYVLQKYVGVKFIEKIIQWKPVMAATSALVKAVSDVLPSDHLETILTVLDAASKGAQTAEDLWKLGQLPKDERNAYAKEIAAETLQAAGIVVTSQIQMIINGIIEIVCMLMPHGVTPEFDA